MIYSKRTDGVGASIEDFDIKTSEQKQTLQVYEKEKTAPVILPAISKRRVKSRLRRSRKLRRRKAFRTLLLCCFALVFGIFTIDHRLFDGVLAQRTGQAFLSFASSSLSDALDLQTNSSPATTLYTRLEYDGSPVILEEQKTEAEAGDVVEISDQTTASWVDGVSYYPITVNDLSAKNLLTLSNGTSYSPDLESLASKIPSSLENLNVTDQPLVLIVHTHGGECYSDYVDMYPKGEATRSLDRDKNVVRVGKEIASTLSSFGISAIHCEIMHDEQSFINAYDESARTVEKYLSEYPSIRFVIDVHRDAIIRNDGEAIKAVEEIGGEDYAQIMFVVGTDERGHSHDNWRDNLSLAFTLQESIDSTYPGLCRSINLRDVPFNQWLSDGYLLLEVGTCSNTLEEALRSARAFGENLARVIYNS